MTDAWREAVRLEAFLSRASDVRRDLRLSGAPLEEIAAYAERALTRALELSALARNAMEAERVSRGVCDMREAMMLRDDLGRPLTGAALGEDEADAVAERKGDE